jgi:predicted nucleic acid-binding protein
MSARILRRDVTFNVLEDKDDDKLLLNVSEGKTAQNIITLTNHLTTCTASGCEKQ